MIALELPDSYGYVLLFCGVLPSVTNVVLGFPVTKARKEFDVQYPNLYATPGFHKKADEFNRVQRGHQHLIESISDFRSAALIGGLKYPLACVGCGILYNLGALLYMAGYKDTKLNVKVARLKKGGPIQFLSHLVVLGIATKTCISLL
mmetsp:Transcript_12378/g.18002  ORF Transcript_12378/g.18002 Transcript_12378/m.18002 type:complete len:148 (+) Transcript_12378:86-529(+)|eukprot:CAMPEP_0197241802 /NCGR_PEP_ID=MMETSP1429-20130617/7736_1 /TAXON_ID=49237 /ORGANISM="Chaetoceros  sp., Strain UNC1202" /LENGTH=147 /DNA_ID=CAMNT_0042701701 /DNA_START=89 /DNA_END=532 /DNA_ORIENTATION=+